MKMARRAHVKRRNSPAGDLAEAGRKLAASLNAGMESPSRRRLARLEQIMLRMRTNNVEPGSPSLEIPRYFGDRWSPLILLVLSTGTYRHTELQRVINVLSEANYTSTISQHILTRKLRALQRDGLVEREVWAVVPPRTDYSLSPLGEQLMQLLWSMLGWVDDNARAILAARQRFDDAAASR